MDKMEFTFFNISKKYQTVIQNIAQSLLILEESTQFLAI